jgi:type VI secretion system protein ImpK
MIALTLPCSETCLTGGLVIANHISSGGIRDLLRDTALLVTQLSHGGHIEDAGTLRQRCRQLMTRFSTVLVERGFTADVREDAEYAQCAVLDETVLRNLSGESRPAWDAQPLQVECFGNHDAGERVFARLEQRMHEPSPNIELLECYSAILGMGFMGRYAHEGEAKWLALITSLNALLEKLRPVVSDPFLADHTGRQIADWLYHLFPWAIAGFACAAAAVIWLIWAQLLDAQLAYLLSMAPRL